MEVALITEENRKLISTLVLRIANNDAEAFEQLVLLTQKDLFNLAMKYLNDYDLANDIVSKTFMRVFDNCGKLKNTGNVYGWMKTILINLCLNQIKEDKRRVRLDTMPIRDSNTSDTEMDLIERLHTKDCFLKLNEDERQVLLLNSNGYTIAEIVNILNSTTKKIRNKLEKAKKKFKFFYEKGQNE